MKKLSDYIFALHLNSFIGDYGAEIGVLDYWVLTENFHIIHFYHSLRLTKYITFDTFSQEAAPLILSRIGDDSLKGTPFFAYLMNFMQLMYI